MILRQSWRAYPASHEPRRNLRPRLAALNQWARIEAIHRNREFLAAYRDARRCLLAGDPIPFPVGTYWLRRFAHVPLTLDSHRQPSTLPSTVSILPAASRRGPPGALAALPAEPNRRRKALACGPQQCPAALPIINPGPAGPQGRAAPRREAPKGEAPRNEGSLDAQAERRPSRIGVRVRGGVFARAPPLHPFLRGFPRSGLPQLERSASVVTS